MRMKKQNILMGLMIAMLVGACAPKTPVNNAAKKEEAKAEKSDGSADYRIDLIAEDESLIFGAVSDDEKALIEAMLKDPEVKSARAEFQKKNKVNCTIPAKGQVQLTRTPDATLFEIALTCVKSLSTTDTNLTGLRLSITGSLDLKNKTHQFNDAATFPVVGLNISLSDAQALAPIPAVVEVK